MRDFRLKSDLVRAVAGGYAFPLGIEPGDLKPPVQGYTIAYTPGEEDEPDTYVFHVVVSHERLRPILHRAFELLGDEVLGIVEIGSRDAYRSVDVFLSQEPVPLDEFLRAWQEYEVLLLEDATIAAGANCEEPFVEVFLDHAKGLFIHVPLETRDEVEAILQSFGLEEVPQTWSDSDEDDETGKSGDGKSRSPHSSTMDPGTRIRPILDLQDEYSPDIDELLLQLRHDWRLELNVDPQSNVDEGGRELGLTLWHAVVLVEDAAGDSQRGAYVSIWANADSLEQMERLVQEALEQLPQWRFAEMYTIDRVAYDERPEELSDLPPKPREIKVLLVRVDAWPEPPKDLRPPGPPPPGSSREKDQEDRP